MTVLLRSDLLRVYVALLFFTTYGLLPLPPALAELHKLSDDAMGNVTGREGLKIDINLDASVNTARLTDNNGFNASGSTGHLLLGNLEFGSGSTGTSGTANLLGLTVDADGSQGVVVGAPSGDFTAHAGTACVDNDPDLACVDDYGQFTAENTNVSNSVFKITGRNDGVNVQTDINATVGKLRYKDGDGDGTGNSGSLQFNNFQLGDRSSVNGAITLNRNMTIDADASQGLVVELPSEPAADNSSGGSSDLDLEIDNVLMGDVSTVPSAGKLFAENFTTTAVGGSPTELNISGNGDGLVLGGQFFFNAHRIVWDDDPDNTSNFLQLGATFGRGEVRIHNGSDGPVSFSGWTLDLESDQWLALDPSSTTFDVDIPELRLGNGSEGIGINVNSFQITSNTTVKVDGKADGLKISFDSFDFDIDGGLDLKDYDGAPGNSTTTGVVRIGGNWFDIGESASLSSLTFDVDQNKGAVIGLPSGSFGLDMEDISVGSTSSQNAPMGDIDINNINFNSGSKLTLKGTGDGVDLGIKLNAMDVGAFRLEDNSGWESPENGNPSGGNIVASNSVITLQRGSSNTNPADVNLNLDGTEGAVVTLNQAHLDYSTDTIFLGSDSGGTPSEINTKFTMDGTTVDVFSR